MILKNINTIKGLQKANSGETINEWHYNRG